MAKIESIRHLFGFIHGLGEFAIKQGRKTLCINIDSIILPSLQTANSIQ